MRVLLPLTAVGALLGTGVSLFLQPPATASVLAAGTMQLGATAAMAVLWRRPALAAIVIAVTSVVTTFADPVLAQLTGRGASAWLPLAIATAAQLLFRRARDTVALTIGGAALVVASAGPVGVNLAAGFPVAAALLAGAVPMLVGTLIAVTSQLNDARRDRLTIQPSASGSTRAAVDRQVALAVMRLRELAGSAPDAASRRAAADAAHLLHSAVAPGGGTIRVEILPPSGPGPDAPDPLSDRAPDPALDRAAARSTPADPSADLPPSDLSDREREILRLLATGASNAVIGRDLYLSEATVKQYASRLMRRFDCENRTQLALMAHPWFSGT